MKIGDLVKYENPESGFAVDAVGLITDIMEFEHGGYPMYEVVCTDPYDRGWYDITSLQLISESSRKTKRS